MPFKKNPRNRYGKSYKLKKKKTELNCDNILK